MGAVDVAIIVAGAAVMFGLFGLAHSIKRFTICYMAVHWKEMEDGRARKAFSAQDHT